MIRWLFAVLLSLNLASCSSAPPPKDYRPEPGKKYKVGLCVMATGRYDVFAQEMIETARQYFCKGHDVTYFVFTDGHIPESPDVVKVYQQRLGWPHDTLKRFHVYYTYKDLFKDMDYVYALDADMRFVGPVGSEILGGLVGTQHPGYVGKRGTYETKKMSTARVGPKEGKFYFAGGFYGGAREEFIRLLETTKERIDKDLKSDYIAIWHDESHLNRYFIDREPTLMLSPAYCHPENAENYNLNLESEKKIIALDKNHKELRKA